MFNAHDRELSLRELEYTVMLNILSAVAEQRLGYSFGKPLRVDPKTLAVVLPIIRETSITRQYTTFPETEKVDVFDTGSIDKMETVNRDELNVFIRSGTLFKGSTQERALMRSAVLFPGKKQTLGVRCVHASRGISPNSKVIYGGLTPHDFDKGNYDPGFTPKDQSTYWGNAAKNISKMHSQMGTKISRRRFSGIRGQSVDSSFNYAQSFSEPIIGSDEGLIGSAGPDAPHLSHSAFLKHDDLASNFTHFSKHFDDVLSKVKRIDNQAGLALINHAGVETIEFFDHELSWKALHEAAVKRLGSNIMEQKENEAVFEYKPEAAVKMVTGILGLEWKTNQIYRHRPNNGEPEVEITGLSAQGYVGEAVELNGALIHLVILKQE